MSNNIESIKQHIGAMVHIAKQQLLDHTDHRRSTRGAGGSRGSRLPSHEPN